LARAALQQLKLDKVYFVLSPRSPFKLKSKLTSAPIRLQMLRLALRGRSGFRVGTWELQRRGPSYTVATLAAYHQAHPRDRLFFILGSDAFAGFERWKNPRKILKLATLVVGRRPGASMTECVPGAALLRGTFPDISSTDLRNVSRRRQLDRAVIPSTVRSFILKRKLYRVESRRQNENNGTPQKI
jgi:nicotinate-nucleotide adenylyltransferase